MKLPEINGYTKYFDNNNKYMNLLANDKFFLKKDNEIWDNISNLLEKRSDIMKYQKIMNIVQIYL